MDKLNEINATSEETVNETDMSANAEENTEAVAEENLEEKVDKKKKKNKALLEILDWAKTIGIAVVIALLVNFFIIINAYVPSGSMENTISTKSRMIGFRLAYMFDEPERGDIIIFKYPDDESRIFTKRIIGLPGETITIVDGVVYVNDEPLDEPYLKEEPADLSFGPYEVPEESYFCLGDNRNMSNDARYWTNTYVSEEAILGKAIFSYYPKFKILK